MMSEQRKWGVHDCPNGFYYLTDSIDGLYIGTGGYIFDDDKDGVLVICELLNEKESIISALKEENEQLRQFINKGRRLSVKELMNNINENELLKKKIKGLEKDNEQLKKRVYDFEKRKIIEESEMGEDVIPRVELLRTELFGEKYE